MSPKSVIFIRDLCRETRYPAWTKNCPDEHLENQGDRCHGPAGGDVIYGYVSVWLFCDIVPGQPDAAAAAMKMCLSVIRLFNLSEGTGLSVSLTLANPRPGAHTRPHYMRALLKYFLISEKIFSFHLSLCQTHHWWVARKLANLPIGAR